MLTQVNAYGNLFNRLRAQLILGMPSGNTLPNILDDEYIDMEPGSVFYKSDTDELYVLKVDLTWRLVGGGIITGASYVEVEVGTTDATDLGITAGLTNYVDAAMAGKQIEVERNGAPLPSISWNGGDYFTKVLADDNFTFANALVTGELIKIKIL